MRHDSEYRPSVERKKRIKVTNKNEINKYKGGREKVL
jgi:hypothetical protein